MLFEDTYLTINEPSEGILKDKGSKFLSFAIPVRTEGDVKGALLRLRKEHPAANHHCYAFRLGADKLATRANDDGEPSNTAGKPILGQIQSKDLTNILIVVVRYFGGTLLGVGGLINAYKLAAASSLENARIVEGTVSDVYEIKFDYLQMNDIMKLIRDEDLNVLSRNFEMTCSLSFSVRKNNSAGVYDLMKKIKGTEITYLRTI